MFDKIKVGGTKRSTFDLSHNQVTTSDFGYLIPICYRDMVPNDDFVITPHLFTRLSPLAVPTFTNAGIKCRVHHFFVPYRILYGHWDAFITQDKSNHTVPPYFTLSFLRQLLTLDSQFNGQGTPLHQRGVYGRLMANLGLNPELVQADSGLADDRFSAFPFLAYYRIWLDWFADANIYDHPTLVSTFNDLVRDGGALSSTASMFLLTRNVCFKKDYFTTAKLNPQDGDPSLVGAQIAKDLNPALVNPSSNTSLRLNTDGTVQAQTASGMNNTIGQFTIEALRAANSLQRYLERNNFVGSKIINRILAHFGVQPTAERLDMAEFIGGDSFPIQIGDVTCTSAQSHDSAESAWFGLGAQAGKGVGGASFKSYRYHAREHGIFMSVLSILPDTGYYQGISRFWQKGVYGDALDYFHPEFENLGYQELLNREVYVPKDAASYQDYDPEEVFGYVPRYAEYKFQNDVLAGDFLGVTDTTPTDFNMDSWHTFRKFNFSGQQGNYLTLNENFVECNNRNNDYDRIFQYTDTGYDHFYFSIKMDIKATRPMTGFTAPSLDFTNEGDGNSMNLPYGGTRL